MKQDRQLTATIEREGSGCAALDVASQGETVEEARRNLLEAVELFLETADPSQVESRLSGEIFVTRLDVALG